MKFKVIVPVLMALLIAGTLPMGVDAAQVDCDATYCFSSADFSQEETLVGICITELPDPAVGTVMLGQRVVQPGDIFTAQQVGQMTFHPLRRQTDMQAQVTYLPVYEDRVESAAAMSIAVIGKTDQAPVAEDSAMETYKNLPNEALLKVKDPEGQPMTFTVIRQPKRGDVVLREDGSFHYTPDKNKVGIDSFTYTATDPAGNVSREATVTITITKASEKARYTDTVGEDCRFAAEWMKNTGLFVSEEINGNRCFRPDKTVSHGEFLTMLAGVLELEPDAYVSELDMAENVPVWLKPYVAAALRSGLLTGVTHEAEFDPEKAITGAEAAVMLQNALDLKRIGETEPVGAVAESELSGEAELAMSILAEYGIQLDESDLTRADAAQVIYQVSLLAPDAPGTIALRIAQ